VAGSSPRPLGRHHLHPADAATLVIAADIGPGDLVLDLGAGHGALTGPLAAAGARVIAVEVDPRALAVLARRFGHDERVRVVEADLRTVALPHRPFRVVANLPFAGASAALRRLLASPALTRADVVVQRGAAVAWATESRRRTPAARRRFDVRLGPTIRAARFRPPPSVDASILIVVRAR
jgi:23S rRNA (adenine-N6)-dimethyltransferase